MARAVNHYKRMGLVRFALFAVGVVCAVISLFVTLWFKDHNNAVGVNPNSSALRFSTWGLFFLSFASKEDDVPSQPWPSGKDLMCRYMYTDPSEYDATAALESSLQELSPQDNATFFELSKYYPVPADQGSIDSQAICQFMGNALVPVAVICWTLLCFSILPVFIILFSYCQGDPELNPPNYHFVCTVCQVALAVVVVLQTVGMVFACIYIPNKLLAAVAIELKFAGSLYFYIIATVATLATIPTYFRDKKMLKDYFLMERLLWDENAPEAPFAQKIKYDLESVEQAKFGGLERPSDVLKKTSELSAGETETPEVSPSDVQRQGP
eukprot:GHVS01084636.1.p1 GENE.GHVS01084636.1~~GHVS01084636.1.p1  ORF type:complete len:325 (+),score=25.65 GHVS01084636.1:524-1498(+)